MTEFFGPAPKRFGRFCDPGLGLRLGRRGLPAHDFQLGLSGGLCLSSLGEFRLDLAARRCRVCFPDLTVFGRLQSLASGLLQLGTCLPQRLPLLPQRRL